LNSKSIKENNKKKWLKVIIGLFITGLALLLSFRKLALQELKTTFLQANVLWVILSVGVSLFVVFAIGFRWHILLQPKEKISVLRLFRLNIISQYINIIVPGRFGEITKAYLLTKKSQIPLAYAMGTVAVEKIFDFVVFVSLCISAPLFFALQKDIKGYKTALFICFVTACLLLFLTLRPKLFIKGAEFFTGFLPQKLKERFLRFITEGIDAFDSLKKIRTLTVVIGLTVLFIVCQVFTIFILFRAYKLDLPIWAALFVFLARQVTNIPPSVPGKIGLFEYSVILALSVFGVAKNLALSYGIMLHLVVYLPKIILGLIFVSTIKWSSIKRMHMEQNGLK